MQGLRVLYNRIFRRQQRAAIIKEFKFEESQGRFHASAQIDGDFREFTRTLVDVFRSQNGVNYVNFRVYDEISMEVYVVSIQRDNGVRPEHANVILRLALTQIVGLERMDSTSYDIARNALWGCGYLKEDADG